MNEWEKNRRMAESYRQSYPPGTRLELIGMDDPFAPIPAGMRGTVNYVDDQSQIHVKWDNGSGLALIPDTDSFRRLSAKEIEAENAAKGSVVSRLTASKTQPGKEREEGRRQAKPNKKKEDRPNPEPGKADGNDPFQGNIRLPGIAGPESAQSAL